MTELMAGQPSDCSVILYSSAFTPAMGSTWPVLCWVQGTLRVV